MKVLSFGEILWDLIGTARHIGGAPLNFAAHFVKCGGEATMVSRVGTDDLGTSALQFVADLGVNTSHIQTDDRYPTGTVMVTLEDGSPLYEILTNVAYDHIQIPSFSVFKKYDALYFGTLAQRSEVSRMSLYNVLKNNEFNHVFYDVNLREGNYNFDWIRHSLESCTIFKLNDEEISVLSKGLFGSDLGEEDFLDLIFGGYPNLDLIILTLGARGCLVQDRIGSCHVPAEKIKVKDTVGAGDAFSASFLYSYLTTRDAVISAQVGNKIGGYVASMEGAIPEYSQEIREILSK